MTKNEDITTNRVCMLVRWLIENRHYDYNRMVEMAPIREDKLTHRQHLQQLVNGLGIQPLLNELGLYGWEQGSNAVIHKELFDWRR